VALGKLSTLQQRILIALSQIRPVVADPTPIAEVAQPMTVGDVTIMVETRISSS
jgi:hypothetical protein